ncbi:MAG: hypothetical protein ACP5E5_11865 [Acidobacteriaceae bacterium]
MSHPNQEHGLNLPSPTAWPVVLALGLSLLLTGMVTNVAVSILGVILAFFAFVGWFRQVLPEEAHQPVEVDPQPVPVFTARRLAQRLPDDATSRKILPVETYFITSGIRGGIAGGAAMAVPAMIYGLIKYHSIWYAINLLAAGGFMSWIGASNAFLSEFHLSGLLAALAIHGVTSILVGLLYGAMLPMFPKYPIVTAGFIAPLLLTGIVHSAAGVISPILDHRIDWLWFIVSQIAFGLVCGFVVDLQVKVRTPQFQALPFAVRAGLRSDIHDRLHNESTHSDGEDTSR